MLCKNLTRANPAQFLVLEHYAVSQADSESAIGSWGMCNGANLGKLRVKHEASDVKKYK